MLNSLLIVIWLLSLSITSCQPIASSWPLQQQQLAPSQQPAIQPTIQPRTTPSVGFIDDSPFYTVTATAINGPDMFEPVPEKVIQTTQLDVSATPVPVYHNSAAFINAAQTYNCTVGSVVQILFRQAAHGCGKHCVQFDVHTNINLTASDTVTLNVRCNGSAGQPVQLQRNSQTGVLSARVKPNQKCQMNQFDYLELFYVFRNQQHSTCQTDYYAYQV